MSRVRCATQSRDHANVQHSFCHKQRAASYSNQVAAELLMKPEESDPDANVTIRDLAADPLPHVEPRARDLKKGI